jgi:hypothetical protein
LADSPRDYQIKAFLGAIRVDAVQNDLAGAQSDRLACPSDGFTPRPLASAMRENLPPVRLNALGVDGHDDALAAKLLGAFMNQIWPGQSRRIDAHLVSAGLEHRLHIVDRSNPAPNGKGHEAALGHSLDHIDHRSAPERWRLYKNQFIRALIVVSDGQLTGSPTLRSSPLQLYRTARRA